MDENEPLINIFNYFQKLRGLSKFLWYNMNRKIKNLFIMLKAYKYRIYPNQTQTILLNKHFGCNRFVFNWGLDKKIKAYKQEERTVSCFQLMKELTQLKKQEEFIWLKEVDSQSLQQSLNCLDKAYTNFFRDKKGFPKFKSKHHNRQSYQIPQRVKVDWGSKKIQIPKIGKLDMKISRKFEGDIRTTTVSKTPTGKFFVSILVDNGEELPNKPKLNKTKSVGVDLGIKEFAITSNGEKFENPKHLKGELKRLKVLQKRASKKVKGSNNRKKANLKVAILHEKIANRRSDFLHKLSTKLVRENQTICLETLNVKNMTKNHKLAQSIQDCSWSKFMEMIEYKSEWYGTNILRIGQFEPSSKMCNCCGYINRDLELKDRMWKCPECNSELDRDINASKNILDFSYNSVNLVHSKEIFRDGQSRRACGAVAVRQSDEARISRL